MTSSGLRLMETQQNFDTSQPESASRFTIKKSITSSTWKEYLPYDNLID